MSLKLNTKELKDSYNIIAVGYCGLSYLLEYGGSDTRISKIGYTCGVYGWNSDIYLIKTEYNQFLISTGYRPIENIKVNNTMYKNMLHLNQLAKDKNTCVKKDIAYLKRLKTRLIKLCKKAIANYYGYES